MAGMTPKNYKNITVVISKFIKTERGRFILWLPVLSGAGISLYFNMSYEPSLHMAVSFVFLSLLSFLWGRNAKFARYLVFISFLLLIFSLGFLAAKIKTEIISSPVMEERTKPVYVHGVIESIEPVPHGFRMVLNDVDIWKYDKEKTPGKIRLTVRTKIHYAAPGDKIGVRAILYPPPPPVYPGGYDMARAAFFKGIGAYGFSLTPLKIIDGNKKAGFYERLEKLRFLITKKISNAFPKDEKGKPSETENLALALLVGEQNAIGKEVAEELRASGLYHLVSISGLHMAIVMGTTFLLTRFLLALSEYLTIRHDIKKWAAVLALLAGFIYLLIAGLPIPAVRSYIMAALFFVAILLDRTGIAMLPIAWAAIAILLFEPEAVLGASFQMSFAAVTALVAAYERSRWFNPEEPRETGFIKKFFIYFAGIAVSSVIAGLATAPFVIYHFGQFQLYGILANLIAIPITSFIVMTSGMFSFLLMPFGLEKYSLMVAGYGIDMTLEVAEEISALPYATLTLPPMEKYMFITMVMGGLWLAIFKTKARYFGLIFCIFPIFTLPFHNPPDVIVDGAGKLFAMKGNDERLYFSDRVKSRFARLSWAEENGLSQFPTIREYNNADVEMGCDDYSCRYKSDKGEVIILKEEGACAKADFLLALSEDVFCPGRNFISLSQLKERGTHAIWLPEKIIAVKDKRGSRPWVNKNIKQQEGGE